MSTDFARLNRTAWQLGLGADPHLDQPLAGRYRCTRLIGIGGTSVVLAGVDESLGREVALKIWNADLAARHRWGTDVLKYSMTKLTTFAQRRASSRR